MDSLEFWDFSSFIIFSDDPWSLLVSFCQLFKLPLVVQCCNVICEWPLRKKSIVDMPGYVSFFHDLQLWECDPAGVCSCENQLQLDPGCLYWSCSVLRGPQHSNTAPRGGNLGKLGEVCRKFQKLAFLCEYDHGPRVSVISPTYFILIFVWWAQADASG